MKRILWLACSWIPLNTNAQNPIPNPGFESWVSFPQWDEPEFWGTPNPTTFILGFETVTADSSSYSGALAVRMATKGQGSQTVPGVICTGVLSALDNSCTGGFPVSQPYGELTGFYKYAPVTGDSAQFYAAIWEWNAVTSKRDTLALAKWSAPATPEYTAFSIPFNYSSFGDPDSAIIIISTTEKFLGAPAGTILLLDDLALTGTVGIKTISATAMVLYPNPVDEVLHVAQYSMPATDGLLFIYDITGRLIHATPFKPPSTDVDVRFLPDGIYRISLLNPGHQVIAMRSLVVKH